MSQEHLDFGEVWETDQFHFKLPIRNRTDTPVLIENFWTTCACSSIAPPSLEIPPQQTREVELKLDLIPTDSSLRSLERRPFAVEIAPKIKGHSEQIHWELKGTVKRWFQLDRQVISFGQHSELCQPLPTQKLMVTPLVPIKGLSVKTNAPWKLSTKVRHIGNAFAIDMVPAECIPVGRFRFTVQLKAEERESKLPALRMVAEGVVVDDCQALPGSLSLGAKQVGQVVKESVTLRSLSGSPFEVESWVVDGSSPKDTSIELLTSDRQSKVFMVSQRVAALGEVYAKVVFRVTYPNQPTKIVPFPIRYLGVRK